MNNDCVLCGRCLAVCPVYLATRDEKLSARGRQSLIKAKDQGRLTADRVFRRSLSACLLCGSCERVCVNEVKVRDKVLKARVGLSGSLKRLALTATAEPGRMNRLAKAGRRAMDLIGVDEDSGLRLRYAQGRVNLPALAERPLRELFPRPVGPPQGPGLILFPGCLINFVQVKVGLAAVRVLTAAGFRVKIPPEAGCCGLPAESAGLNRLAQARI
ncbi:MAG: (Fe-S)-binding protein, partial [Deltaproteobacteria bacterium]|nr:(Fe-S)-binding protein [Deltaproteobacteria bacterium]